MASRGPEPGGGGLRVPVYAEYRGPSPPGVLSSGEDAAPAAPEAQGSCRRRNVLTERERRKRMSASCERLRALLPRFDGRREDMASVLEMAVQFLRLSRALVPGEEQHVVESPLTWDRPKTLAEAPVQQRPLFQRSFLASSSSFGLTRQDPTSCASMREDEREVPPGLAEVLDRRTALLEPPSLAPAPLDPSFSQALEARVSTPLPRWPALSQRPASPLASLEAQSWLGRAGPLGRGATSPGSLTEEAGGAAMPVLDGRSASGSAVEDSTPFLLTAGPDWWLGPLEGRGGGAHSPPPGRSSPPDRAEPAFLADPEPGFQLLQDSLLAQWGSDLGCSGLALREEADGSFPDVFACCL